MDVPVKFLAHIHGFRASKLIFSACELGVFDLLLKAQTPVSVQSAAQELNTSVHGMEGLLDALVALEILHVETKDGTALYSNTDEANRYLAKSGTTSLHDSVLYYSQTIFPLWNNLTDAVREGKNQTEKALGMPLEAIFQAIYRSEEELVKFMGTMNSLWVFEGQQVVTAFDLSRFPTVVDLGGCTGILAQKIAKANPSSTVTVFDLPMVADAAQKHFSRENDAVSFQSGDFFNGEIPAADLYVLANILHDWPEEKCAALLKKIYNSCKPGGGVLVVEAMLAEDRRGPTMAHFFSLDMLVLTSGHNFTPSYYSDLLKKAGFQNTQACLAGKTYTTILGTR